MELMKLGDKSRDYETELSMLCHQFSLVLKSGIHPVEGIPMVCEDISDPGMKKAIELVRDEVARGSSLHSAFEASRAFPAYMTAMIRVGEKRECWKQYLTGSAASMKIRRKSKGRYETPLHILWFWQPLCLELLLISFKIIPVFTEVLTSLGGEIPAQAGFFMALGNALEKGFFVLIAIIAVLAVLIFALKRTGRFDRFRVENPITGGIYRKIITSRFSGAMALTLKSGLTLTEGFALVSDVLDNSYVAGKIRRAVDEVNAGKPFWEALKDTYLFPAVFIRLVRTGEKQEAWIQ
jgi:Bacterial type II secretion system protein F domain.